MQLLGGGWQQFETLRNEEENKLPMNSEQK